MLHSAHHMYRYVARRSAAASSSLASVARPCLRLPHSSSSPLPRLSMLHAAAASAALHPSQPPSQHARGLTTSSTPTPNAAHKAHAASAESASEFLDDPALLRDQAYVNGKWVGSATSTNTYEVKDPATHVVIAKVPSMGAADTRAAIDAAAAAWDGWRHKTGKERGDVLRRWHDLMQLHMTDLAKILTLENGKPLAESRGEIGYAASFVEFYAEEAKRTYGEVIPSPTPGRRLVTIKQPVGVAALISPWNFPSAMITRKAAPALAAGCPVVIKPAEDTPLSALALAELAERAGVPPGVLNVITCPREHAAEVGLELSTNKDVRKVSFTGSTAVGKILMRDCASTVKKLSLELGGNAPLLVFDDADLENALNGVLAAKFRNAGQTCVSPNRLLVQAGVYDEFVRRLAERVSELQVGHGLQPGVQVGPLINAGGLQKVQYHVKDALKKGAKLLTGGEIHALGGTFFEPTVLSDCKEEMLVFKEETFGPVCSVFKFGSEKEGVRMANKTEFGLAAYVFTGEMGKGWRVAEGIEAGMVGVNEGMISTAVAPFGGVKESGLGREGARGGIDEYMETKYLCLGGIR